MLTECFPFIVYCSWFYGRNIFSYSLRKITMDFFESSFCHSIFSMPSEFFFISFLFFMFSIFYIWGFKWWSLTVQNEALKCYLYSLCAWVGLANWWVYSPVTRMCTIPNVSLCKSFLWSSLFPQRNILQHSVLQYISKFPYSQICTGED